ncbi:putative beta-carotene-binding protein [Xylocopa sonorina]|uniref:putative beta-carotene-binding protein n=1 Tax=Xylocopa sonorina TaxID=1818115 RepID=UPI00403B0784
MFFKQFLPLFIAAIFGLAAAVVPPYIHVCGARNPKLDQCVINSINDLKDQLKAGIPELDVPPGEPLWIKDIVLVDMPNFKATGKDIMLSGLSNYRINSLHVDLQKKAIDLDITFDEARLEAMYNVHARILVPIDGHGPVNITAKDVNAKIKLTYKIVQRKGKEYIYFSSMTTRLNIEDFDIKWKIDNFDGTLREAFAQALGSSHKEIIETTRPNIEKAISENCLSVANKICRRISYDELFPDRE